ncbi:hypothetical protein [Devosia sp. CN2-171]|uniref:hypothetical protein n=1 Tax=Devosia sp. CN2-171 TaxID=3400909 RepID=UPI003BF8A5EB
MTQFISMPRNSSILRMPGSISDVARDAIGGLGDQNVEAMATLSRSGYGASDVVAVQRRNTQLIVYVF